MSLTNGGTIFFVERGRGGGEVETRENEKQLTLLKLVSIAARSQNRHMALAPRTVPAPEDLSKGKKGKRD